MSDLTYVSMSSPEKHPIEKNYSKEQEEELKIIEGKGEEKEGKWTKISIKKNNRKKTNSVLPTTQRLSLMWSSKDSGNMLVIKN